MIEFNLLPWREALQKEKNYIFFTYLVGFLSTAILGLVSLHVTLEHFIISKKNVNQQLQQRIDIVVKQINDIQRL